MHLREAGFDRSYKSQLRHSVETERLIFRPVTVADAEEIYTNWTSDPEVAKYVRWSTHSNVNVTKELLSFVESNHTSDTTYDWGFVRKSDNKLIRTGGLYYDESYQRFEIGYNIMRDCWHQGYTSEAAQAMIVFAVEALGETRLCGRHAKENPNSGKVIEKVGFRYIKDGYYESFDGTKQGETREYILEVKK